MRIRIGLSRLTELACRIRRRLKLTVLRAISKGPSGRSADFQIVWVPLGTPPISRRVLSLGYAVWLDLGYMVEELGAVIRPRAHYPRSIVSGSNVLFLPPTEQPSSKPHGGAE